MYSLDQELAFATEKLKRQRAYIQELEDAVTPEIKTLKARISELEAIISVAPHTMECINGISVNGLSAFGCTSTTGAKYPCTCWKSKVGDKKQ